MPRETLFERAATHLSTIWHFLPVLRLLFLMFVSPKSRIERSWLSISYDVPLFLFSHGCRKDFRSYLDPQSSIEVRDFPEIFEFLSSCEYVDDSDQFDHIDYWQHPMELEAGRRGDCEDFALWAWAQLVRLGYETEFMVGRHGGGKHAWVTYSEEGVPFLLESTARDTRFLVRPLDDLRQDYVPVTSVDHRLRKRLYGGFVS